MNFAYIADIHLSSYSQDKIENTTNLPERLHGIKQSLDEVAMYCINNGIKYIFIGGDTLHGKSVIYAIAQELMIKYFQSYGEVLTFVVIDGNHDLSGKGNDVISALRPLQNIKNVIWVPFSEVERIENMLLVPYSYNMKDVIKNNKSDILISHFGLSEAMLNSGMSIVSDLNVKQLRGNYKLVLLGHYHKPQEMITDEISIYYAGSTIQIDWGEKGDEKRFLIVNSETLQVKSIPFTKYKKHIELVLNSENSDEILSIATKEKEAGNHIKIIKKEELDTSKFDDDFIVVDKTEADIINRGIESTMTDEDKLRKYLEIKKISPELHDRYFASATKIIEDCEV